jgi:ribosomal protein S18 acetylase RimI-like enzyme
MIAIRAANEADFEDIWRIFHRVVAKGDSYVFPPDATREDARGYWLSADFKTFVTILDGAVVGMYKLRPNNIGLGAHVANASFMVDPECQGRGIGKAMGLHCLEEARCDGYLAMQFNFVVSTNTSAVKLWQQLGFEIVGTLPKAFQHAELGLVDAYVMYRFLDTPLLTHPAD